MTREFETPAPFAGLSRPDRVLVVDDDAAVRHAIATSLRRHDYEVIEAPDGALGLAMARSHRPDIVLSDIEMPGMDGPALLAALRAEAATASMPLVFLTGRPERLSMREGIALGADDYLAKPFSIGELLSTVQARLVRHRQVAARAESLSSQSREHLRVTLPHELLTPLCGVLGLSELLRDDGATLERSDVIAMAAEIHQSGLRLLRCVHNLTLYDELVAAGDDPALAALLRRGGTYSPAAVVRDAARSLAAAAGRSADVSYDLSDAPVAADVADVRRFTEELVDNALKFSGPSTAVKVSCGASPKGFALQVVDEGRGMGAEQIDQIRAFHQFDRKRYEQQGLGLGLAILSRLAAVHGGSLELQSEPGRGTTATVTLPSG